MKVYHIFMKIKNKDVGFTTFLYVIFPTSLLYHLHQQYILVTELFLIRVIEVKDFPETESGYTAAFNVVFEFVGNKYIKKRIFS